MPHINLKNIFPSKENTRVKEVVAAITSPLADIEVKDTGNGFEIITGHTRLNCLLEVNGRALVRVLGTDQQFMVHRNQDGTVVRI